MHKQMKSASLSEKVTLLVVVAMSFFATLDSSIVNIALPVMSKSLSVPLSSIEWVVAGYVMIICSTLLFFGRLGDIVGKTKVFSCGSFLFTLGTLLCGLCQAFVPLIFCRFLEGLGASAYMANNQGIITELYPGQGRGKALGILAAGVALGTLTGLPLGGLIVSALNWHYLFFAEVPIGAVFFILGLKFLPHDKEISGEKIDKAASVLQFFGTMLLFGVMIQAQKAGFLNPYILGSILVALILAVLFIVLEKRHTQPLLELSLFKSQRFTIGLACALISYISIASYTLLFPFFLENTLKLPPSTSGLLMMIAPLIIFLLSAFCGMLSDKIGSEVLTVLGLLSMAVAFFLMSFFSVNSSALFCAVCLGTMAIGQSFFQPANNSLIMSACPKNKLGIGGSVNSLVRNLGQYVGIILSTTLLYTFMSEKLGHSVNDYVRGRDDVFVFGMKNVYLILMMLCILGILLTSFRFFQTRKTKVNDQRSEE